MFRAVSAAGKAAVEALQYLLVALFPETTKSLKVDGILGPKTMEVLQRLSPSQSSALRSAFARLQPGVESFIANVLTPSQGTTESQQEPIWIPADDVDVAIANAIRNFGEILGVSFTAKAYLTALLAALPPHRKKTQGDTVLAYDANHRGPGGRKGLFQITQAMFETVNVRLKQDKPASSYQLAWPDPYFSACMALVYAQAAVAPFRDGSSNRDNRLAANSPTMESLIRFHIQGVSVGTPASTASSRPGALAFTVDEVVSRAKAQGITGQSLVNLLAIVKAESGFKVVRESHLYRSMKQVQAAKLTNLYHLTEKGLADLVAQGREAFFAMAYKNRAGNGSDSSKAAMYYGRGLIQLTGYPNYAAYSAATGSKAVSDPDILFRDREEALASTLWFWKTQVKESASDIRAAVRKVAGPHLASSEVEKRVKYAAEFAKALVG